MCCDAFWLRALHRLAKGQFLFCSTQCSVQQLGEIFTIQSGGQSVITPQPFFIIPRYCEFLQNAMGLPSTACASFWGWFLGPVECQLSVACSCTRDGPRISNATEDGLKAILLSQDPPFGKAGRKAYSLGHAICRHESRLLSLSPCESCTGHARKTSRSILPTAMQGLENDPPGG